MDAHQFDDFTRVLGRVPRRSMLKLFVAGVAAVALDRAFPRGPSDGGARAAILDCGLETWQATCPVHAQLSGFTPIVNGCGPQGGWVAEHLTRFIPDSVGAVDFKRACDNHDRCYQTCGVPKAQCDINFYNEAKASCDSMFASPAEAAAKYFCEGAAAHYLTAVYSLGACGYASGQQAGCFCCPSGQQTCTDASSKAQSCVSCPPNMSPNPANGCQCACPAGQTVCNGACVINTCSGGQIFSSSTCKCECPVSCPSGQSPDPKDGCKCKCSDGREACYGYCCSSTTTCCTGFGCVDLQTDGYNCGACGRVVDIRNNESCVNGSPCAYSLPCTVDGARVCCPNGAPCCGGMCCFAPMICRYADNGVVCY
jgi:hypothetical protein